MAVVQKIFSYDFNSYSGPSAERLAYLVAVQTASDTKPCFVKRITDAI